jgi:hypothetical protein
MTEPSKPLLFRVMNAITGSREAPAVHNMPADCRLVLIAIANRASNETELYSFGLDLLEHDTNRGMSTVRACVAELLDHGHLVHRGWSGPANRAVRVFEVRPEGSTPWPATVKRRETPTERRARLGLSSGVGAPNDGGATDDGNPASHRTATRPPIVRQPGLPCDGDKPPISPPIYPPRSPPNEESAPACARVGPEPSATVTPLPSSGVRVKDEVGTVEAPALPGLEGLVVPKAESDAAAVWAAYLEGRALVAPKGPPPVLDSKRRRLIAARLKDGFTLGDLCDAARGIWRSEWWVENKRTALDYAIKDATRIEEFRLLGRKRTPGPPPQDPPRALNRPPSNVTLEEAIAAIRANPYFPQPERTIAGLQAKIALRDAAKAEGQAANG